MRISAIVILLAAALAACTKHNPDTCCTTQAQCDSFGLDQIYPCDGARVCDPSGLCIAPQCATSAECTSPDAPICEGQLCVPKCATDDECVGIASRPYCASDGVCVGCEGNTECSAAAPVCDTGARSCRGCTVDAECPGGVCQESNGTCVADDQVVFVKTGGADTNPCTRLQPCATLTQALISLNTRSTIHILGATFTIGNTTQSINRAVYLDGENTTIYGAASVFQVGNGSSPCVMNNLSIPATTEGVVVNASGAKLVLYQATVQGVSVTNGGILEATHSTFTAPSVEAIHCVGGSLKLEAIASTGMIGASNCQSEVRRSRISASNINGMCASFVGGSFLFENNLVVASNDIDCAGFTQAGPSSAVRFNTIFNITTSQTDKAALACDNTATVTDNIIAYNSRFPHSGPCISDHSLYDLASMEVRGDGSFAADASTFFVDSVGLDFHLAAQSPAIGKGLSIPDVTIDLDGHPRPSPMGTAPDIGAYEAL